MADPSDPARTGVWPRGASDPDSGAPADLGAFGPYRVLRLLGRGGMGAVYHAHDTRLDREVALKMMLPEFVADPGAKERFLREARAAARITHDNVVTVYEADEREGVPYIAMQLLRGFPLDEFLRSGIPPLRRAVRVAREAADGLSAAHALGLVHRDIKPSNLWLEEPTGRVKVLDFGLVKPAQGDTELTRAGALVGSPSYMSPEQAAGGAVDHRADLFSLGVVLYRMCAGRVPFDGPTVGAVLMALGRDAPDPVRVVNPTVPAPLADLIHQLLAKNPDARPHSAAEVAQRLRAIEKQLRATPSDVPAAPPPPVSERSTPAPASAPTPRVRPRAAAPVGPRPGPRRRALWLALAALVVALGVVAALNPFRRAPGGDPDAPAPVAQGQPPPAVPPPVAVAPMPRRLREFDQAAERRAVEWVLKVKGSCVVAPKGADRVDGRATGFCPHRLEDLPAQFEVIGITLEGEDVTDQELSAHLSGLSALEVLQLNCGSVTTAGLSGLAGSPRLRAVSLTGWRGKDQYDEKALQLLASSPTIEAFAYTGPLPTQDLTELARLPQLRYLNLTNVHLESTAFESIATFPQLHTINISHVPNGPAWDEKTLTGLVKLRTLRALRISSPTVIPNSAFEPLEGATQLETLGLLCATVDDRTCARLSQLPRLSHLTLITTNDGLAKLAKCPALEHLNLSGSQVEDAGARHLANTKTLRSLTLDGTWVTERMRKSLRAALPQCAITPDP